TKSGTSYKERKPNGTIHFVEMNTAQKNFFNFYQPLFKTDFPKNLHLEFNKNSLIQKEVLIEGGLKINTKYEKFEFIRKGYFSFILTKNKKKYFNEIVSLKKVI
ncbi:MAG: glutamine--tRNA ligase, partial [Candidatus Phytoplasma stylosanthis]|nr:glutamine--tRNA ligase [Candidatus Phytoplasma stylosanthis]